MFSNWSSRVLAEPVKLSNQHPLSLIHTSFFPEKAKTLNENAWDFSTFFSFSSTVNRRRGKYLVDAETRTAAMSLRYGMTPSVELALDLPLVWRGAGFADSLIDSWHQAFGLPEGARQFVPDDTFQIFGENQDGSEFSLTKTGFSLAPLRLGSRFMTEYFTAGLFAGLPTGRAEFSARSADFQGAIYKDIKLKNLALYFGGAYTYFTDTSINNLRFQHNNLFAYSGLGLPLNEKTDIYLGLLYNSALVKDVIAFPDYGIYLDSALRFRLENNFYVNILLRENPLPARGTTDVTFTLELRHLS